MTERGDISLSIFITSMSGNKSLTSFAYGFFHFRRPPGLKLAFDAAKGMNDLAAFSARELKRAAAEEREWDECFSAEDQ